MISRVLAALFVLLVTVCIQAEDKKFQRNLSIVLDLPNQVNGPYDAMVKDLYNMLLSKSSIILTDMNVWNAFKLFIKYLDIEPESFIEKKWDIYRKDNFLILISHIYKNKLEGELGINLNNISPYDPNFEIVVSKVDDLKKKFFKVYYRDFPYALDLASNKLIALLSDILISKEKIGNIEWNIYLSGHGSDIHQTSGISESGFVKLLDLFDKHINTHSFYFSSCFAGGKMTDLLFGDTEYSYSIFSEGLDSVTYAPVADGSVYYPGLFDRLEKYDFNNKQTSIDIAEYVVSFHNYKLNQLVAVSYPKTNKFTYLPVTDFSSTINENSITEDISNLNDTSHLVCESAICPVDLFLKHNNQFISGLRGNACHYIEKSILSSSINIENCSIAKIVSLFALEFIDKFTS